MYHNVRLWTVISSFSCKDFVSRLLTDLSCYFLYGHIAYEYCTSSFLYFLSTMAFRIWRNTSVGSWMLWYRHGDFEGVLFGTFKTRFPCTMRIILLSFEPKLKRNKFFTHPNKIWLHFACLSSFLCMFVWHNDIWVVRLNGFHFFHSFIDLPNLSASIYSTELCTRLRAFLIACPPTGPSPPVAELVIATADFQRDLVNWNIK